MYTPLINSKNEFYNGIAIKLGETPEHFSKRPQLQKINNKKIVVLCVGASTPGQISAKIESMSLQLANVQVINCCTGGQDINDWLSLESPGWSNLEDKLVEKGLLFSDVQCLIFGTDELVDDSNAFPSASISYGMKVTSFISLAKTQFVNLKQVDLMSRLCEYKITDPKFATPSGYNNGWGHKFAVETAMLSDGTISGVWITDATAYLWTDGETIRSDGFKFSYSWMKRNGASVHLNTSKIGDDTIASYIFNNMKRYSWFY